MENTPFVPGTSVSFQYTRNDETFTIYARILSQYRMNPELITCITPHGSIFRVAQDTLHFLTDRDELSKLEFLEKESLSVNYNMYNTLFDKMLTFEISENEVV